jgi:hypothetical protein
LEYWNDGKMGSGKMGIMLNRKRVWSSKKERGESILLKGADFFY